LHYRFAMVGLTPDSPTIVTLRQNYRARAEFLLTSYGVTPELVMQLSPFNISTLQPFQHSIFIQVQN